MAFFLQVVLRELRLLSVSGGRARSAAAGCSLARERRQVRDCPAPQEAPRLCGVADRRSRFGFPSYIVSSYAVSAPLSSFPSLASGGVVSSLHSLSFPLFLSCFSPSFFTRDWFDSLLLFSHHGASVVTVENGHPCLFFFYIYPDLKC